MLSLNTFEHIYDNKNTLIELRRVLKKGGIFVFSTPFLYRVLGVVGLFILGLVILALTDFGSNAIKLMRESRTELRRVVWPSRPETTQTFLIVFGSIVVLCLVFWGLESLLSWLTKLVLG